MKNRHLYILIMLFLAIAFTSFSCQKNMVDSSGLYVPTVADTTANATLLELQEGRLLFIDNCGACHSLYSPESFTPSQWKNIISQMAPRTTLSGSEVELVTKYLCKGQQ